MEQKTIGILFSGGLESTSLINMFRKKDYEINLLYLKFGYTWEEAEISFAKRIAEFYTLPFNIIDYSKTFDVKQLGFVTNVSENIIPLRNLSLLTFAAIYFFHHSVFNIAIGLQGDLSYPDTSLKYIEECESLIKQGLGVSKFSIQIPFYGQTKEEILKNNCEIPLNLVFSCTNPINLDRCQKCYKCLKLNDILRSIKRGV